VLHQIGAGTLGPVFRAYDADRERLVAVKLFRLDLSPERVHKFVAALERLIDGDLSHPAVAAPLATGMRGVEAYLATEYVAAESLDLAVREYGPAPPADALRVAAQLAGALDFAAVVKVAHGAIHPRDVLLASDETRITGLGIANALESVGVAPPIRRPYTAPERVAGAAWDRRADIFSLAALIHELLFARRIAGTGGHAAERLTELAGADLPTLRNVFARALAEDPSDRFATALEFAEALKHAFVGGEAAVAVVPPPAKTVDRDAPEIPDVEPRLPLEEPTSTSRGLESAPLREQEQPRFQEVETPPVVVARAPVIEPSHQSTMKIVDPPLLAAIEPPRARRWPIAAALIVGAGLGFAAGYGLAERDRLATTVVDTTGVSAPVPGPSAGRESTEVAVAEPAVKPAPDPQPNEGPTRPREAGPPSSSDVAPQPPATPNTRAKVNRESQSRPQRPSPFEARSSQSRSSASASRSGARQPNRAVTDRPAGPVSSGTAGRYNGQLRVESRPDGARVYLDGRLLGTTPLQVATVSAGEHAIRIELDGYRRWSSSVRIVAAEQNRVTASLER
jgi:serine/threonine protein kinase